MNLERARVPSINAFTSIATRDVPVPVSVPVMKRLIRAERIRVLENGNHEGVRRQFDSLGRRGHRRRMGKVIAKFSLTNYADLVPT